ncbi:MAG TPA: hypothetical protein VGJ44_15730, partial [Kribbellaceae bacterium]
ATVGTGFATMAAGFLLMLRIGPGTGYDALWPALAVIGLGFGITMPAAGDALLGSLPQGRESTGTALSFATRQVGGAFGIAVLGSLVTAAYRDGVTAATAALPGPLAGAARESVAGAAVVADRLGPAGQALHDAAAGAYVTGMHHASIACAVVALGSALLLATTLPGRISATRTPPTIRDSATRAAR